jgi:hypothetical protein
MITEEPMGEREPDDRRFEAIGAAAAAVLRTTEYHRIRTQDVAAHVRLEDTGDRRSAGGGRSAVWLYNEVRSRRVLVALGAKHAWEEHLAQSSDPVAAITGRIGTVTDAMRILSAAVLRIARFHRVEDFLTAQVHLGLGDIATSEKRPQAAAAAVWPDSPWGRVATQGYSGRCAVYADHLAPVIERASACVVPLSRQLAAQQAADLSDLLFRSLISDRDGPLDRIADGFAAYWLERDLIRVAGPWVRDLHTAERVLSVARRQAGDARAAANARSALVRVLLEAETLYARCAEEGAAGTADLHQLLHWNDADAQDPGAGPTRPAREPADLRALCDTTNRHGLAAHRFGDLTRAIECYRASRTVARVHIAGTDPADAEAYTARAEHNLAEAALDRGLGREAEARSERVYQTRKEQLDRDPRSAAAWRRLSLTESLLARAAAAAGHPARAVSLAERLLADRLARAGRPDHRTVADARSTLGRVLLAAGHPLEARHEVETAHRLRFDRSAVGHPLHPDQMLLARIALELDQPDEATRVLPDPPLLDWCEQQARSLLALAAVRRGESAAALAAVQEAKARLGERIARAGAAGGDPDLLALHDADLLELDRVQGQILLLDGRPEEAGALLLGVRDAEPEPGGPAAAGTLLWLARCADARRDGARAAQFTAALRAIPETGLDRAHPVRLAAELDHARRLLTTGAIDATGEILAGILDPRLLGHRRPALEQGHPLLRAAQLLAGQIGLLALETVDAGWEE